MDVYMATNSNAGTLSFRPHLPDVKDKIEDAYIEYRQKCRLENTKPDSKGAWISKLILNALASN